MSEGMAVSRTNAHARPPINMYPHLSFEPYRYIAFPMWVYPQGVACDSAGIYRDAFNNVVQPTLCHDEEERQNALGGSVEPTSPREADEKLSLYAMAEQKGIVVDRRWGMDTLKRKVQGVDAE